MDCTGHEILHARILKWVAFPFSGIKPRSPTLQVDSLPAEPQGKPKNTGVGSLSLLQWIFLTQEFNWGLLHWEWVLYCLSGNYIQSTTAYKWSQGFILIIRTLTVIWPPLSRARDYSQGFHDHFLPVLGALWSCVLFRLKEFESMVAQEKKEKEKQMAAIKKNTKNISPWKFMQICATSSTTS